MLRAASLLLTLASSFLLLRHFWPREDAIYLDMTTERKRMLAEASSKSHDKWMRGEELA